MSGITLYNELTPEVASAAHAAAERIRVRMSRTAQDIIEIGLDLIEQKKALGHGNYLTWIEAEFSMSDETARNFTRVAAEFGGKSQTVWNLPPTILYSLAAPSNRPITEQALAQIDAGKPLTNDDVAALKEKLKAAKAKAAEHKQQFEIERSSSEDVRNALRCSTNEALFLKQTIEQSKQTIDELRAEVERLKQEGVIHVYPQESEPGPVVVDSKPRTYQPLNTHAARAAELVLVSMDEGEVSEFIGLLLLTTSEQIADHVRGFRDERAA